MEKETNENVCGEEVFSELFKVHAKDLYNFLYYKYGADNNPHDMVQDAFLKLWNNCEQVTKEKARSFLFTVANNQLLNEISKKKTALKYSQQKSKIHTHESPEFLLEEDEFMDKLQTAIENLSEEQRVAFLMNRIEGKKHKEIAEMLGVSRKTIEKRIYSALSILRGKVGNI